MEHQAVTLRLFKVGAATATSCAARATAEQDPPRRNFFRQHLLLDDLALEEKALCERDGVDCELSESRAEDEIPVTRRASLAP
ncbi:hypothetical protein [Nannocystis punicea]|uniref:Secreted protein n=1 Tax=Nannocystis punicea TaxID=2995304 RepID=A0ABY7GSU7_9BACT|nr:hypothetical protein [Nannocystis poenicansa]WAS90028.1 hypothetical protein O0S08_27860 [Nannocystis poenicansa]